MRLGIFGITLIDPLRFLAGCRKRRLNQALCVLSLSVGFVCVCVVFKDCSSADCRPVLSEQRRNSQILIKLNSSVPVLSRESTNVGKCIGSLAWPGITTEKQAR